MSIEKGSRFLDQFGLKPGDTALFGLAHPDDEMSNAETMHQLIAEGVNVRVALATNGTESTLGDSLLVKSGFRRIEALLALWEVGVPAGNVDFLQNHPDVLKDGELDQPLNRLFLTGALAQLIVQHSVTAMFTPGKDGFDGHSDHIALHDSMVEATATVLEALERPLPLIWATTHYGISSIVNVPVDADAKLRVLRHHTTQMPMLPKALDGYYLAAGLPVGYNIPRATQDYIMSYAPFLSFESWELVTLSRPALADTSALGYTYA